LTSSGGKLSGNTYAGGSAGAGGGGNFVLNAASSNQYSHANTGTRAGTTFGSASENSALGVAAGYGGAHSKVGAGGSSSTSLSGGHR